MTGLVLHLTNAGVAAIEAATGSDRVTITEVGLTATPFDMAPTLTAIPGEFKRLGAVAGTEAAPNITHMSAMDSSADVWNATGFGLYLDDGTLFAIYSSPTTIISKAAPAFALIAFDIAFDTDMAALINFGNPIFTSPPATTEVRGLVELATPDETAAGVDNQRAITPLGLSEAVSPVAIREKLVTVDGAGSGIDADMLDGHDSSYFQPALGFLPLPVGAFTAAAILSLLEGVDGSGSGLDADMLDGHHAGDFLLGGALTTGTDFIRFPGNLILQFGKWRTYTAPGASVSVPLPHPLHMGATPLAVFFAIYDPSHGYNPHHLAQGDHTNTTLTFRTIADDDGDAVGLPGFDWFALGNE